MLVAPGTEIEAQQVEHGMIVDTIEDLLSRRIDIYEISTGPNDEIELTDSRGTAHLFVADDRLIVRGYFNP